MDTADAAIVQAQNLIAASDCGFVDPQAAKTCQRLLDKAARELAAARESLGDAMIAADGGHAK